MRAARLDNAEPLTDVSSHLAQLGEWDAAELCANQAESAGDEGQAYWLLARHFIRHLSESETVLDTWSELDRALARHPDHATYVMELVKKAADAGHRFSGIVLTDRAIATGDWLTAERYALYSPDANQSSLDVLAFGLLLSGDASSAERLANLLADAGHGWVAAQLATEAARRENWLLANRLAEKALPLGQYHGYARIISHHESLGDSDSALALARHVNAAGFPHELNWLAVKFARQGDWVQAERTLGFLESGTPQSLACFVALRAEHGEWEEAVRLAIIAAERDGSAGGYSAISAAKIAVGDMASAEQYFATALKYGTFGIGIPLQSLVKAGRWGFLERCAQSAHGQSIYSTIASRHDNAEERKRFAELAGTVGDAGPLGSLAHQSACDGNWQEAADYARKVADIGHYRDTLGSIARDAFHAGQTKLAKQLGSEAANAGSYWGLREYIKMLHTTTPKSSASSDDSSGGLDDQGELVEPWTLGSIAFPE